MIFGNDSTNKDENNITIKIFNTTKLGVNVSDITPLQNVILNLDAYNLTTLRDERTNLTNNNYTIMNLTSEDYATHYFDETEIYKTEENSNFSKSILNDNKTIFNSTADSEKFNLTTYTSISNESIALTTSTFNNSISFATVSTLGSEQTRFSSNNEDNVTNLFGDYNISGLTNALESSNLSSIFEMSNIINYSMSSTITPYTQINSKWNETDYFVTNITHFKYTAVNNFFNINESDHYFDLINETRLSTQSNYLYTNTSEYNYSAERTVYISRLNNESERHISNETNVYSTNMNDNNTTYSTVLFSNKSDIIREMYTSTSNQSLAVNLDFNNTLFSKNYENNSQISFSNISSGHINTLDLLSNSSLSAILFTSQLNSNLTNVVNIANKTAYSVVDDITRTSTKKYLSLGTGFLNVFFKKDNFSHYTYANNETYSYYNLSSNADDVLNDLLHSDISIKNTVFNENMSNITNNMQNFTSSYKLDMGSIQDSVTDFNTHSDYINNISLISTDNDLSTESYNFTASLDHILNTNEIHEKKSYIDFLNKTTEYFTKNNYDNISYIQLSITNNVNLPYNETSNIFNINNQSNIVIYDDINKTATQITLTINDTKYFDATHVDTFNTQSINQNKSMYSLLNNTTDKNIFTSNLPNTSFSVLEDLINNTRSREIKSLGYNYTIPIIPNFSTAIDSSFILEFVNHNNITANIKISDRLTINEFITVNSMTTQKKIYNLNDNKKKQRSIIFIESSVEISIHSTILGSCATFLSLPDASLGKQYIIPSFPLISSQIVSFLIIVSPTLNNYITVIFPERNSCRVTFTGLTIMCGETLELKYGFDAPIVLTSNDDIEGTVVRSENPVLVMFGHYSERESNLEEHEESLNEMNTVIAKNVSNSAHFTVHAINNRMNLSIDINSENNTISNGEAPDPVANRRKRSDESQELSLEADLVANKTYNLSTLNLYASNQDLVTTTLNLQQLNDTEISSSMSDNMTTEKDIYNTNLNTYSYSIGVVIDSKHNILLNNTVQENSNSSLLISGNLSLNIESTTKLMFIHNLTDMNNASEHTNTLVHETASMRPQFELSNQTSKLEEIHLFTETDKDNDLMFTDIITEIIKEEIVEHNVSHFTKVIESFEYDIEEIKVSGVGITNNNIKDEHDSTIKTSASQNITPSTKNNSTEFVSNEQTATSPPSNFTSHESKTEVNLSTLSDAYFYNYSSKAHEFTDSTPKKMTTANQLKKTTSELKLLDVSITELLPTTAFGQMFFLAAPEIFSSYSVAVNSLSDHTIAEDKHTIIDASVETQSLKYDYNSEEVAIFKGDGLMQVIQYFKSGNEEEELITASAYLISMDKYTNEYHFNSTNNYISYITVFAPQKSIKSITINDILLSTLIMSWTNITIDFDDVWSWAHLKLDIYGYITLKHPEDSFGLMWSGKSASASEDCFFATSVGFKYVIEEEIDMQVEKELNVTSDMEAEEEPQIYYESYMDQIIVIQNDNCVNVNGLLNSEYNGNYHKLDMKMNDKPIYRKFSGFDCVPKFIYFMREHQGAYYWAIGPKIGGKSGVAVNFWQGSSVPIKTPWRILNAGELIESSSIYLDYFCRDNIMCVETTGKSAEKTDSLVMQVFKQYFVSEAFKLQTENKTYSVLQDQCLYNTNVGGTVALKDTLNVKKDFIGIVCNAD